MKSMRPIHYVIIAVVLFVVLGLLYWRYRRAQQQNKSLEAELKVLQPYHKGPEPAPILKKSNELKPSALPTTKPVVAVAAAETNKPAVVADALKPKPAASSASESDSDDSDSPNPFTAAMLLQEPIFKLSTPTAIIPPPSVLQRTKDEEADSDDADDDGPEGEPPLLPANTTELSPTPISVANVANVANVELPLFAEPVVIMSIGVSAPLDTSIDTGVAPNITEIVEDPQEQAPPQPSTAERDEPDVVVATPGKKGPKRRGQAAK